MLLAAAAALAIVAQDEVALRAAPRRSAQQQAQLWQGDALEVRGAQLDYLQVYDHRRERAGYVPATAVRFVATGPEHAAELLAVARFLRDTQGAEALGIAYVAAHLQAVPAEALTAEPFAALGAMAERLAQRASARTNAGGGAKLAAQLETVRDYGVAFDSFERDGRLQLCYDGEAYGRVLAMPAAAAEDRARAALGLTRPECIDPALGPLEVNALNAWRAKVLDRVVLDELPPLLKNRVRMRRAGLWAALAFADTREGRSGREAGERALTELAAVVPAELPEEDRAAYTDAAVRVGASRWAAEPDAVPKRGLRIVTRAGEPGETCVALVDDQHGENNPLVRRCTYGTVWPASASVDRAGTALALAVQPQATWREVWVFHKARDGWTLKVLPPSVQGPDLGYVEFAGWVPHKARMLVAREARVDGRWQRSFEVVRLDTLAVVGRADEPAHLSAFYRWQAPAWQAVTVSLR